MPVLEMYKSRQGNLERKSRQFRQTFDTCCNSLHSLITASRLTLSALLLTSKVTTLPMVGFRNFNRLENHIQIDKDNPDRLKKYKAISMMRGKSLRSDVEMSKKRGGHLGFLEAILD